MEPGCLLSPSIRTPEHIALAERLGFKYAWVADSPTFMADAWVTLGRAIDRTSTVRLGVCALTPKLRHVVATAGAAATLNAVAPGRIDLVIGTGFTSQAMLNQRPAKWSEAATYLEALRGLLAGDEIEWDGEVVTLPYGARSGIELPADVRLMVAAHGPKGLEVGRRLADGVVTNPGHGSNNDVWAGIRLFVQINGTVLAENEDLDSPRVLEAAGPAAALHLHIAGEGVAADTPEVAGFQSELSKVDPRRRHIETHRGHLTELTDMERRWITPAMIRATTETGTPEEMREHLGRLAEEGVSAVLYFPAGPDVPRELEKFIACMPSN